MTLMAPCLETLSSMSRSTSSLLCEAASSQKCAKPDFASSVAQRSAQLNKKNAVIFLLWHPIVSHHLQSIGVLKSIAVQVLLETSVLGVGTAVSNAVSKNLAMPMSQ